MDTLRPYQLKEGKKIWEKNMKRYLNPSFFPLVDLLFISYKIVAITSVATV
jgi:hypothetical protein